jgi:hypothetical protein
MIAIRAGSLQRIPSRQVLAALPARVVSFLHAIGSNAVIRTAMARSGFSERDHQEGFALLGAVCRYPAAGQDEPELLTAREAEEQAILWVRTHFDRLIAAVRRQHPADLDLFGGIEAPDRSTAVLALATLLSRLDARERQAGSGGEVGAETGAVTDTLARRGLDRAERARLAEVVRVARSAPTAERAGDKDPRRAELLALHDWYADWTATARVAIGPKSLRIALGIASRAAPRAGEGDGDDGFLEDAPRGS